MPIQIHDVGTQIVVKVREGGRRLDLSGATMKQIVLTRPDGGEVAREAGFLTDGSDGVLAYTTVPGDIGVAGKWTVQAAFALGIWSGRSTRADLLVRA